jgi:hypothetical protein
MKVLNDFKNYFSKTENFKDIEIDGKKVRYNELKEGEAVMLITVEGEEEKETPIEDSVIEIDGKNVEIKDGKIVKIEEIKKEETKEETKEVSMSIHEEYEQRFSKIEKNIEDFASILQNILEKFKTEDEKEKEFSKKEIDLTELKENYKKLNKDIEKIKNLDGSTSIVKSEIKENYRKYSWLDNQ